ncbi:Dabb family protein [Trujillonella humicola]|uniref:Dabb family protein n=1 Tax=Trujillonella humicola TaxID=3383699 RepID=UPI0039068EB1
MRPYRHLVLFRFRDDVDADARAAAYDLVEASGRALGLLSWRLGWSLDTRKGAVLVQDAVFADRAAFEAWRDSAAHRRAGAYLSEVADWLVGDVEG